MSLFKKLGLSLVIFVAVLCVQAEVYKETVDGIEWTYQVIEGKASIGGGWETGEPAVALSTSGAITVPYVLGGYQVTAIGYSAFLNCGKIASVTIPSGVTLIDAGAFAGCSSLVNVTIPDSVRSIGEDVFEGCNDALFDIVTIPGVRLVDGWVVGCPDDGLPYDCVPLDLNLRGIRGICVGAFGGSKLGPASVFISGEIKNIPRYAFDCCEALRSVIIEEGVENIGDWAFSNCKALTNLVLPSSLKSIGDEAFYGCPGLSDSNGFVIVGGVLFGYYGKETEITIPSGVTQIASYAFDNYESSRYITKISIPNGVVSIGDEAFRSCESLREVDIPNSIARMGYDVFGNQRQSSSGVYSPFAQKLNTQMYKSALQSISGGASGGGSSGGGNGGAVVVEGDARYDLSKGVKDRGIASIEVSADTAIDAFVLTDGKVFDAVLYVNNTADSAVKLSLPSGYTYKSFKGAKPLIIPPKSSNVLTITRVADKEFLVSRKELECVE